MTCESVDCDFFMRNVGGDFVDFSLYCVALCCVVYRIIGVGRYVCRCVLLWVHVVGTHLSISMSMFYMSCPYVPYLILGTAIAKIQQKNRMLGYGTGTGTGTVREGKGRYTGYLF